MQFRIVMQQRPHFIHEACIQHQPEPAGNALVDPGTLTGIQSKPEYVGMATLLSFHRHGNWTAAVPSAATLPARAGAAGCRGGQACSCLRVNPGQFLMQGRPAQHGSPGIQSGPDGRIGRGQVRQPFARLEAASMVPPTSSGMRPRATMSSIRERASATNSAAERCSSGERMSIR